jgi:hypothetical protein
MKGKSRVRKSYTIPTFALGEGGLRKVGKNLIHALQSQLRKRGIIYTILQAMQLQ